MGTTGTAVMNPYGFNFDFNRTQTQTPQAPAPTAGGMGGGFGTANGGTSIANGQYRSPYDITDAQNRVNDQNRSLDAQKALEKLRQSGQMDMQQAQFRQQNSLRDSIMGQVQGAGSWGTAMPEMPHLQVNQGQMGPAAAHVQHIQMPDFTAAQNAAFARAKDREGQMATGALSGLRSAMGGRGMLGSGLESRGTANIANKALGNMGEVNREQAIQGANANVDMLKTGYQGDITQRGQDITQANNMNNNNLNLAQMQFQADLAEREGVMRHNESGQQFMQNLLLGLMRSY